MRAAPLIAVLLLPALAGCAPLPVARDTAKDTEWPVLLPIDEITDVPVPDTADPALALEARAAALRARAAALSATDP